MKKINVICKTSNNLDGVLFHIILYDDLDNKIYDYYFLDNTIVNLKYNKLYKVIIMPPYSYYPEMIFSSILTSDELDTIKYYFRDDILSIKVKLVDQHYGLLIKEGKIILWQDHIQ